MNEFISIYHEYNKALHIVVDVGLSSEIIPNFNELKICSFLTVDILFALAAVVRNVQNNWAKNV